MAAEDLLIRISTRGAARSASDLDAVGASAEGVGKKTSGAAKGLKRAAVGIAATATAVLGAGKALYDVGAQFDDAYDAIRVGTGATGAALAGLQDDFRAVAAETPATFADIGTAIADLNTRLGLTGEPLQELSAQVLELSRLTQTDLSGNIASITRAFGDWEVSTKDASSTLDFMFRASQMSGASVEQLAQQVVQFGAPLRQVGYSLEEATAMFATFERAGVNTSTMMPGLKQAMKTFFEEGIDPKQGLAAAFKGIQDGSIGASEAIKIFGVRAGGDMIEAVKQGRFNVQEMVDTLEGGSDSIMRASQDTRDFAEEWQIFRNKVLLKLEPVALRVFAAIGTGFNVMQRLGSAIGSAVDTAQRLAPILVGVTVALVALNAQAIASNIAFAAFAVRYAVATTAASAYAVAQWAVNAAMTANPIGLIVAAIALLVGGLVYAWRNSETFRAKVTAVWTWIKDNWPRVLAMLAGPIGAAVSFVVRRFDQVKATIGAVFRWIKSAGSGIWDGMKDGLRMALNFVIGNINRFVGLYNGSIGQLSRLPGVPNIEIPEIPMLAQGGVVRGTGSAIVGDAGMERLDKMPDGSVRVTPLESVPGGRGGGLPAMAAPIVNVFLSGRAVTDLVVEAVEFDGARA